MGKISEVTGELMGLLNLVKGIVEVVGAMTLYAAQAWWSSLL